MMELATGGDGNLGLTHRRDDSSEKLPSLNITTYLVILFFG